MKLVIVESPAKAKTIMKYLAKDFKVIASFGHIRAIESKKDSVIPEKDFLIKYAIVEKHRKYLNKIIDEAQKSEIVFLATDPDREGEAISWHIYEILKKKLPSPILCKRITFHEITKQAILTALEKPKEIDQRLVNAQQARQALDYLVGFSISPLLWRKVPGCRSAGRVQSVALRLVSEREGEIESFKSQEYWSIELETSTNNNETIHSKLVYALGKKLTKLSIQSKEESEQLTQLLKKHKFVITDIETKQKKLSGKSCHFLR